MSDEPRYTTTDGGQSVASDEFSLTVGPDGPVVLQDHYLIERLVTNVSGHLSDGVTDKVLERAFQYWKNIDPEIGARIEHAVGAGVGA